MLIKLIKNELNKVKKSKLFFSQLLYIITLFIMNKYSDKSILDLSYYLIPFVSIITCIFFGGTINGEIENGNFRYYLTKPIKRWKIYLSKLLTMLLYVTFSISLIILFSLIFYNKVDYNYIYKYYLYSIPIYFTCFFVLYLSTILKNQSLSVGLSIFIISFSLIISQLLFGFDIRFIEYTFLPYLDFSIFNDKIALKNMNSELGINLSINKAIIIDVISMFIMYILGNFKFKRKDIKN